MAVPDPTPSRKKNIMKSLVALCSAIALIGTVAAAEDIEPVRSQNDHRATLLIQHAYESYRRTSESMTTTPEMTWAECLNLKYSILRSGNAQGNRGMQISGIDVSKVACLDLETGMSR